MYKTFEGRAPFTYKVKAFDDLLQTEEMPNSFVLYQEQEMAALHYAGIPMSDCYTAIKNIAKKRTEKVLAYKETFKQGFSKTMIENEHKTPEQAQELSDKLWQIIEDSAAYSFNCVSGDTRIQRTGGNSDCGKWQPTIAEMYRVMNDSEYANKNGHHDLHSKYHSYGYGSALSMYDDLRIHNNKIVGIYPSGIQQTYKVVTESGRSICCTMNHRFPTTKGKMELKDLKIGDLLYCKGKYEKNRHVYTFTDGSQESNCPKAGQIGFQKRPDGGTVVYKREREIHISQQDSCELCGCAYSDDLRFELHHKDLDRTNNTPENYQWLCVSCHKKQHYKNGRKIMYQKGIPTYLDPIVSITPWKMEETYDIEMADPAHTFVTDNGLVVSNCSHSYCVALDSLYSAWVKAHHPVEFYETALSIYEKKGDKDKMAALREEAQHYFGIKFPPLRFRQDNTKISGDVKSMSISNSMASIKGFGLTIGRLLFKCAEENANCDSFMTILEWLDKHSLKAAKIEPLIKIDYFQEFGSNVELLKILAIFDFFGQGQSKSIKKDKLNPQIEAFVAKHGTDKGVKGNTLKSYTITDMSGLLHDLETYVMSLHLEEISYKVRATNQNEILGYVDLTTGREEDRKKLYVLDVYSLNDKWSGSGKPWIYKIKTKSIGSGKVANLSVRPNVFEANAVAAGDIIIDPIVAKDKKQYWWLSSYKIL